MPFKSVFERNSLSILPKHHRPENMREFWLAEQIEQPISTNKTNRHDITEILLKVALNTIEQTSKQSMALVFCLFDNDLICCEYCNLIGWSAWRKKLVILDNLDWYCDVTNIFRPHRQIVLSQVISYKFPILCITTYYRKKDNVYIVCLWSQLFKLKHI